MNDARNEVQVDHSIGEISPTLWVLFNFPRLQNSRFFFLKSVKKLVMRGVRVLRGRSARASHTRVPDLLFDCSRVLEYPKIRTVLQSKTSP